MALAVSLSVCSAPVGAKWVQENNGKWWYYYDNNPQNYAKNGFKKLTAAGFISTSTALCKPAGCRTRASSITWLPPERW